jgi:two-component system sensor histidine kinase PilS (NtrC family)
MYYSAGVASGLGVVILVSVAAGAILVQGRISTAIAAVAAIAVLYEEFYLSLTPPSYENDFFQAGVLGALYFATSISIQILSSRLRRAEISSMTNAAEAADLERVNRSIIARMRTGIIVVAGDGSVRMINQSARSLLGFAAQENDPGSLPAPLAQRLTAWRNDTRVRAGPFQIAATMPEIRANFSAVRMDRPDGDIIVFLEDTTEIQQQAQQLKLAALGRLSATIAHEIRNPLSAARHAAQLLGESLNLDKGDTRLISIIDTHCQRMNGVIENVLELSRRRPPTPVRLNLASWLEGFVTQFKQANMADVGVRVQVQPADTEVRVDPTQLAQAVTNLALNALRYSREHSGESFVALEGGVDTTTDRPYLNVIDHGPGVADDQVSNLFEPFFTTERTGTGLGLYISKELCEANQARISYTRHRDGGSCFRITFAHPDRITA